VLVKRIPDGFGRSGARTSTVSLVGDAFVAIESSGLECDIVGPPRLREAVRRATRSVEPSLRVTALTDPRVPRRYVDAQRRARARPTSNAMHESVKGGAMATAALDRTQAREGDGGTGQLARGLGWFGIGLGLAEIAMPNRLARMIGIEESDGVRNTMFAFGIREIASGIGILSRPESPGWVWARVGGDVMDLAALGSAFNRDGANRGRLAAATAAVAGVGLLDVAAAGDLTRHASGVADTRRGVAPFEGVHVTSVITIGRPAEEVYRFWRDLENLPRFMEHLESVRDLGEGRSHWRARAPAGRSVEWNAEIVEDRPNELIAWRSLPGSDVPNQGSVRFARGPGGDSTEVHVEVRYDPPAGALGAAIAKLFGEEPKQQISRDLRRLKQVLETGEPIQSDASIHHGMHPARPPEEPVGLAPRVQGPPTAGPRSEGGMR
jgi:uncharacterized membrane protein